MHFRSCFLWSTLWVFGLSYAVPREGSSDVVLLVRDDALASEDFPDPLITSPPPTGPLSTSWTSGGRDIIKQPVSNGAKPSSDSPGSTLLAQNTYNNGAGVDPITGAVLFGVGAGIDLFTGRIHDINQVLQDDHPTVKVIPDTNHFKKTNPSEDNKAGAATTAGKATPNTASGTGQTDLDERCPPERFENKPLPWCDVGLPGSVGMRYISPGEAIVNVIGYPRKLLPRRFTQFLFVSFLYHQGN